MRYKDLSWSQPNQVQYHDLNVKVAPFVVSHSERRSTATAQFLGDFLRKTMRKAQAYLIGTSSIFSEFFRKTAPKNERVK